MWLETNCFTKANAVYAHVDMLLFAWSSATWSLPAVVFLLSKTIICWIMWFPLAHLWLFGFVAELAGMHMQHKTKSKWTKLSKRQRPLGKGRPGYRARKGSVVLFCNHLPLVLIGGRICIPECALWVHTHARLIKHFEWAFWGETGCITYCALK